jgi:putative lipase involved disintegration of autophagic bodies
MRVHIYIYMRYTSILQVTSFMPNYQRIYDHVCCMPVHIYKHVCAVHHIDYNCLRRIEELKIQNASRFLSLSSLILY